MSLRMSTLLKHLRAVWLLLATFFAVHGAAFAQPGTLRCDDSMKTAFKPDANTVVLKVQQVHKGESYPNDGSEQGWYPDTPAKFAADLCWVKLLIGPAIAGPPGAPSTSRGIGIEVWLPEKRAWNHRFHGMGTPGWGNGSNETVLDRMNPMSGSGEGTPARLAAEDGFVTSTSDNGQQVMGGAFAMNPDGSPNGAGWRDWSYRGLYEQAVKTKALIKAYYGELPRYSYFSGGSGGGRQGLHITQNLPEQYDGIFASVPGPDWSSFIAEVYPAIVVMRDLDGKDLSEAQLSAVSRAAVAACDVVGGKHLGYILDIRHCRYDPTKDVAVLCKSDSGINDTPACLTRRQALAMNKIWYGMTVDGSVPDPAIDNGWDYPPGGVRKWYGYPRGGAIRSILDANTWLGGPGVGRDVIALALRDSRYATPGFRNATGNGQDAWKGLSYEQLAAAFDVFRAMNIEFGFNANNPDLTRMRNAGTKLLHVTNVHDGSVWVQGHTDYYDHVMARMGGLAPVQSYYKLYVMPGLFHGNFSGSANREANPPVVGPKQAFNALMNWVENGISPDDMVFESPLPNAPLPAWAGLAAPSGPKTSLPACSYPRLATYVSGDVLNARSYRCR